MPGILRFANMHFLIFKKKNEQKDCARYFEIGKYAFLIFEKGMSKDCARYFEIRKYAFFM